MRTTQQENVTVEFHDDPYERDLQVARIKGAIFAIVVVVAFFLGIVIGFSIALWFVFGQ